MNALSIVHGIPLSEEPGLGQLTIGGYLRDVTSRFAEREALVLHGSEVHRALDLRDVRERTVDVARALLAGGSARTAVSAC